MLLLLVSLNHNIFFLNMQSKLTEYIVENQYDLSYFILLYMLSFFHKPFESS